MDWRKSVCSGILCLENKLRWQGHYPLPVETPWDQPNKSLQQFTPLRQTMGTWAPSHKVLSFLPFLHKTWPLFCIVSLPSRRSLGAGSCSWLIIGAPGDNRLRSWDPHLQDCFSLRFPLCGPVLPPLDHLHKIFQRIPKDHFRRIGQTWFSSQTEVPTFRREPEALDPGIAQASSCMLVSLGWGLYLLLQIPFYSWYPSHTAAAVFMSRKIYYKSSPFPASMVFKEEEKYMALTFLIYVHSMQCSACTCSRWVLGSLVITEVSPCLKVLILHRWEWFQSHSPTSSPTTYSQLFLLSVSSDLFWTTCSDTAALLKVTLEAIHREASHSIY